MKRIAGVMMVLSCFLSSCMVDVGRRIVNEKDSFYDVYDFITVPVLDTVSKISVEFGLNPGGMGDDDIQQYSSDSLLPRLRYQFSIPCPVLPNVKLNSFSFTRKKDRDTIPGILYYRTDGRVIHIIDSLPVIFTNEIKKNMKNMTFTIYAESEQSYASTNSIYINYDIEVGNQRFIKKTKYSKKWYSDWRPKIW